MVLHGGVGGNMSAQIQMVQQVAARSDPSIRIGAIVYGAEAKALSPITADRDELMQALQTAEPDSVSDSGAVFAADLAKGEVLARYLIHAAAAETRSESPRETIAYLVTDGIPADGIAAQTAAASLREAGVRVFVGLVAAGKNPSAWEIACGVGNAPCAENVEAFHDWPSLALAEGVGRVLPALCRRQVPPSNVTLGMVGMPIDAR